MSPITWTFAFYLHFFCMLNQSFRFAPYTMTASSILLMSKVQIFGWRLVHNKLPIRLELVKRGIVAGVFRILSAHYAWFVKRIRSICTLIARLANWFGRMFVVGWEVLVEKLGSSPLPLGGEIFIEAFGPRVWVALWGGNHSFMGIWSCWSPNLSKDVVDSHSFDWLFYTCHQWWSKPFIMVRISSDDITIKRGHLCW